MSESDPFHPEPVPDVDDETFYTTLNQYNALARYEPVITETMEQTRNVALIWWHLVLRLPGGDPRTRVSQRNGAGAKEETRAQESRVESLPEGKHGGCLALREARREPREGAGGHCHSAARAVARANLKHTCSSLTETILRMVENRQFEELHEQRTWRHGDPRKAWAHIIRQGMLGHQKRCSPRTEEAYGSDLCWGSPG